MTGPDVVESTGLPADPDCLHCHLPPLIDEWMRQHPQVSRGQVLIQLAQTLGELVGSSAPSAHCAEQMSLGLLGFIRRSARDVATVRKPA